MNILDLLPWWAKLAITAVLIAAVTAGVQTYNESLREQGRAEVQAKWDHEREVQKDAALKQAAKNADETARRLAAQQKAQNEHDAQMAAARRDADTARAAAGRLSSQLAAFTAAARGATGNTGPVANSAAGGTAIELLAELFSRSDATAGELAAALDASHAAGLQCERSYDALRGSP